MYTHFHVHNLGLTVGAVDSVGSGDPSLRSDMLMSIAMGSGAAGTGTDLSRYSVRHSVHIGLAPADLRLEPANEEMAKGIKLSVHSSTLLTATSTCMCASTVVVYM